MSQTLTQPPKKDRPQGQTDLSGNFGSWLRGQREVREISLREIADTTRINIRYLQALEEERFEILPAQIFAKGFLREYARFVGIDPDEAITFYLSSVQQGETSGAPNEEGGRVKGDSSSPWATTLALFSLILLILAVIAAMAYWSEKRENQAAGPEDVSPPVQVIPKKTEPAPLTPGPVQSPEAVSNPVDLGAPLVVTLGFFRQCWVEADVDGRPAIRELKVAGEALSVEATERIDLKLGDGGAVTVEVNGEPYPLQESAGVLTLQFTAPEIPEGGDI